MQTYRTMLKINVSLASCSSDSKIASSPSNTLHEGKYDRGAGEGKKTPILAD